MISCSKKVFQGDYCESKYLNENGKIEYKDTVFITSTIKYKTKNADSIVDFLSGNINYNLLKLHVDTKDKMFDLFIEQKEKKKIIKQIIINWLNSNKNIQNCDSNRITSIYLFDKVTGENSKLLRCDISFEIRDYYFIYKLNNFWAQSGDKELTLEELQDISIRDRKIIVNIIKKEIMDRLELLNGTNIIFK